METNKLLTLEEIGREPPALIELINLEEIKNTMCKQCFELWASVPGQIEAYNGYKRLMNYQYLRERMMEEREQHRIELKEAFEKGRAMAERELNDKPPPTHP